MGTTEPRTFHGRQAGSPKRCTQSSRPWMPQQCPSLLPFPGPGAPAPACHPPEQGIAPRPLCTRGGSSSESPTGVHGPRQPQGPLAPPGVISWGTVTLQLPLQPLSCSSTPAHQRSRVPTLQLGPVLNSPWVMGPLHPPHVPLTVCAGWHPILQMRVEARLLRITHGCEPRARGPLSCCLHAACHPLTGASLAAGLGYSGGLGRAL